MKFKPKLFAAIMTVAGLALIIAWGATRYYGERRTGQEVLLAGQADILSYSTFIWNMDAAAEVIIDPEHAADARVERGRLSFVSVADTYFNLNLQGHKLVSNHHFMLYFWGRTRKAGGTLSLTLRQGRGGERKSYVSERIRLPEGDVKLNIDLHSLSFHLDESRQSAYRWGSEFTWADGLRLDFNQLEGTRINIEAIRLKPGMVLDFALGDLWQRAEREGVVLKSHGRMIRLPKGRDRGTFVTPPIGLGSLDRFIDMELLEAISSIEVEARTGAFAGNDDGIEWGNWFPVPESGEIRTLQPAPLFQVRFNLQRPRGRTPRLHGFRLRYIDPSPPGISGPLFGTAHLPTYASGRQLTELPGLSAQWLRLPAKRKDFDEALNRLVAGDINVVGVLNLDAPGRKRVLDTVRRYRGRIAVWELRSNRKRGAQYYTDLFQQIRMLDPTTVVFPERVGSEYFQKLALHGQYRFATASGTQEEVLDRGFWWFFVMALLGLFLVISLGPVVGYHLRLGGKELAAIGIGLAASAVILIPTLLLSGLAQLTLPRDWPQIEIAFSRYAVSAMLQEFVRALLLLIPVGYLVRSGMKEKTSWIAVLIASSILFGLGHLGYPGLMASEVTGFVILTSLAGIIFGAVLYWTRSLTAVVIFHLLSNVFLSTMTDIGARL